MIDNPSFKKFVDESGSMTKAAKRLGVSISHVSLMYSGKRSVTPANANKIHRLTRGRIKRESLVFPRGAKS